MKGRETTRNMRKQELVHFHRLLAEIRRHLVSQGDVRVPPDAFDAYDDFGVAPTSLASNKCEHRRAVEYLMDGLQTTLTPQNPAVDVRSASSDGVDTLSAR